MKRIPAAVLVVLLGLAGAGATGARPVDGTTAAVYTIPGDGSGPRTFTSRCFTTRLTVNGPGFRAPAPDAPRAFLGTARLPFGPAAKPSGYLRLTWRGLYTSDLHDPSRGTGTGSWEATGLPPTCRRAGRKTARGAFALTWVRTRSGDVARLRFVDFSP
jgi:hypothetical protein